MHCMKGEMDCEELKINMTPLFSVADESLVRLGRRDDCKINVLLL
jgi:hypothetical protein